MARLDLKGEDIYRLQIAMRTFEGDVEKEINEVLHNEAGDILEKEIRRLMPVSNAKWAGKKKEAKTAKGSLRQEGGNLSITVRTTNSYHYLWFPDDGQNVNNPKRRAAGNQQFFRRAGENKTREILDRCINRLAENLESL